MQKLLNKSIILSLIFVILSSSFAFAGWKRDNVGRYYVREDGTYPMNGQENIDGVIFEFDGNGYLVLHEEEIQKYDQTRIIDYVNKTIVAEGRNDNNQKVKKYFSCNIPQISGYNSEEINKKLETEAPGLIKKYLDENEDFSNMKASNMVNSSVLNESSGFKIEDGYMQFKLSTYGNRNINLLYDLHTGDLSLEQ